MLLRLPRRAEPGVPETLYLSTCPPAQSCRTTCVRVCVDLSRVHVCMSLQVTICRGESPCVSLCTPGLHACVQLYVCLSLCVCACVCGGWGDRVQCCWEWPRRWLRQTKQPQCSKLQVFLRLYLLSLSPFRFPLAGSCFQGAELEGGPGRVGTGPSPLPPHKVF